MLPAYFDMASARVKALYTALSSCLFLPACIAFDRSGPSGAPSRFIAYDSAFAVAALGFAAVAAAA